MVRHCALSFYGLTCALLRFLHGRAESTGLPDTSFDVVIGGNRSSNATCPTQVFFENVESCSKGWWSLTRRNTRKTNEAALDT